MAKTKKKWLSTMLTVLAFVICMGLTAGLTMAFFGNSSTGTNTVTLKTGVKVGATATANNSNTLAVPGQPIDLEAEAVVEPYSTTGTVVPALLRLKFTIGGAMDITPNLNASESFTVDTANGATTGYWVLHTDGYYYLCAEAAEATVANTQLLKFTPKSDGTTKVTLTGDFVVPTSLGNEASGQALDVKARFEVIQAEIYADGSETAIADENLTIGNEAVQEVFGEFALAPYINYMVGNNVSKSVKLKNNTASLTFEDMPVADYMVLIPVKLTELDTAKVLDINYTVDTDVSDAVSYIAKGQFETRSAAELHLYNCQQTGDFSSMILMPDLLQETPQTEYALNGTVIAVDTCTIVTPSDNLFTILISTTLSTLDVTIDFTLRDIPEISYYDLDNPTTLELTPTNVSVFGFYNLQITDIPVNYTGDLRITLVDHIDIITEDGNSVVSDINVSNITGAQAFLAKEESEMLMLLNNSQFTQEISGNTADTVYSIALLNPTGAITEETQLQVQVTLIKPIEELTVLNIENNQAVVTKDQLIKVDNSLLPENVSGDRYYKSFVLKGIDGIKNIHLTANAGRADLLLNEYYTTDEQFVALFYKSEVVLVTPRSYADANNSGNISVEDEFIFTVCVSEEDYEDFNELTFTLSEPQINEIDFGNLTNTTYTTDTFFGISFSANEIFDFTIKNITQNCNLEVTVTFNATAGEYSGGTVGYIDRTYKTGHFVANDINMTTNSSNLWQSYIAFDNKITLPLSTGQNFDFNMIVNYDPDMTNFTSITLSFNIVQ